MLDKLERKFGKLAIRNLMLYIVVMNLAVYLFAYLGAGGNLTYRLMLIPELVLKGEVWRLVTYIFIPPQTSMIWILFTLYFYYLVGTGLEHEWGSFKFNIYYGLGMLGTTLSAFITGEPVTAFYLNLSLFLAFAYIYPRYQIMLFFVLPVQIKYLAWLDALFLGYTFIIGSLSVKLSIAAAFLNFLLFFGKDLVIHVRQNGLSFYKKREYRSKVSTKAAFHRCTVCGITEKDDRNMEFRYCSTCKGDHEYCMNHLKDHVHL